MNSKTLKNPFYHNYLFSRKDIQRRKFNKWEYLLRGLWLLPTYVQINEGFCFYYKIKLGEYYLIKIEELKELKWIKHQNIKKCV